MIKMRSNVSLQLSITVSVLMLVANILLGVNLFIQSGGAIMDLMGNRMLDISNTAADMLDGDSLRGLKKEDEGTEEYQRVNDALKVFQDNIDLEYIYTVRKVGEKAYEFMVDPTIEDPAEFGAPVVWTEALEMAGSGTASFDKDPYTDDWGRFYSAYSPVFDSRGEVAGIVAVDFSAAWIDEKINGQLISIVLSCLIMVAISIAMIMISTRSLRAKLHHMNVDIAELSNDVNNLMRELNPDIEYDAAKTGDIHVVTEELHRIQEALRLYVNNQNVEAQKMITALASDYRSVYYIDLDANRGICYRNVVSDKSLRLASEGEQFDFTEAFTRYANNFVKKDDLEEFLQYIDPENIRKNLEKEVIVAYRYMVKKNGIESFEMLRMAGVRHPKDRDDGIVHAIGVGFTDIDEQMRDEMLKNQALRDALYTAEEASRAKTVFLSNMSHEIRTPMNAIIGLDALALQEDDLPDSTRDSLEKIGSSAQHLLELINDILDMSRIESGRMVVNYEEFSFSKLIEQINIIMGNQCREKGLTYDCSVSRDIADYYFGDSMRLRQVLINILGNAVKFTPEGGRITFTVEKAAGFEGKSTIRFTISDTGIGMSEEFLPKIFDSFAQENAGTTTKYGSSGLGMAITKSIVDMMNGEIEVESTKGVGTTFKVSVTLTDSDRKDEVLSDGETVDRSVENKSGKAELSGRRVLLAEDMEINAEIMINVLGIREISAEHAVNGLAAVEMFASHPIGYYDAILMDMRMPEMDGLDATIAIRAMEREDAKKIPIIALTANAFEEDVQRSLQAGLNAHLSKPVEPDILFEKLEELIEDQ